MTRLVSVTEPLDARYADCAVKRAGSEWQALTQVTEQWITAFDVPTLAYVEHRFAYV